MMRADETEDLVVMSDPMPRLASAGVLSGFEIAVTWEEGARQGRKDVVDLAPAIMRYKVYAPLRDDPVLFRSLHLQPHRFGIAWGDRSAIDMAATMIEDLADETMSAEDFAGFMTRHGFTVDSVAEALGISPRLAAYYRGRRRLPRTVTLACRYIDEKAKARAGL